MASTFLSRSISSTGNQQKMTFSAWIKRSGSGTHGLFVTGTGSARSMILIESDGKLQFSRYNGGYIWHLATNRKLRDTNGWYHIVCALDTTQSTDSNRAKIYINGVQETSLATSSYPSLNYMDNFNLTGETQYVGQDSDGNFDFDGIMSHVHYIDGTAYDASTFGSTDATTGEWKINTSPTLTMGTNGFTILKDGNTITDQSSNSNNFTLGAGTLTNSEDCPSNVFATLNPLATFANITLTNGNNTYTLNAGTWESTPSTLAVPSSGKYYTEFKWNASSTSAQYMMVGVEEPKNFTAWSTQYPGYTSTGYGYGWDGDKRNNASNSSYGAAWGATSIIGVAIDMDNKKLYFHKDGVYQNSGVPTSGSTGTGALSLTGDEYYLVVSGYKNSENPSIHANFGNGYFGTTAVSSAGTNASGIGIFEYDVPTGYTALSTKGLNL